MYPVATATQSQTISHGAAYLGIRKLANEFEIRRSPHKPLGSEGNS